ncbi:MAG: lysylphosphatidylglycerol synthase transmembrane domain-containing protein [Defluviitoga tunisiensis]|jgi:uncharacterized protein (TIRG00374 family)|uniref:Integral membrane protein n=1 Tax=Defluviitoga tunisiensis TaxID=1006576 RepID=A0A0C7NZU4_DEFTU|nr:lysylphosphatidylglycerol synthase transmembrane domain-containing protein [Defluviitoga tunisiensis]HPZ75120.1 lysylphosphatidylglycerol synthase transmembrane domain-containing protein [Candidatus Pacearchaeota archaeon]MDD3601140.1 lysylphosphatidylglycerol synthase transmembrane domain-containing protein [Defluviitoga tunisiensis]CEP77535.1 hypothetical protein DTL3_0204 [Defluviitoga tunisiensis]HHV01447.1 flippase-like domain-containing protein [Defluviitoga tunisiensis]HOK15793.1 lys
MSEKIDKKEKGTLSRKKIIINIILVVIIGFAINIVISFFSDFEDTVSVLKNVNISVVLISFLIFSTTYFIDSIRLCIVTSSFQKKINFKDALKNTLSYYFVSNITPMTSGGQPYQIYHLTQIGIESTLATNIVMSRFIESLIFSGGVILIFLKKVINVLDKVGVGRYIIIAGIVVSMSLTSLLILIFVYPKLLYKIFNFFIKIWPKKNKTKMKERASKLENWLENLKDSIHSLWIQKAKIVAFDFILGGVVTFLHSLAFYAALAGITGVKFGIFDVFILFIIMNFVVYYVPTPGSTGGVEAFYGIVLSGFIQKKFTSPVILIWRFSTYYLQIVFEILVLFFIRNNKKDE